MPSRSPRQRIRYGLLLVAIIVPLLFAPRAVQAQPQDGATMTVLRGHVALLRSDGSAVQPAPSGSIVRAGDEIRTLSQSGAAITFFAGTEIEMGEETTLILEEARQDGTRIEVSLRQVFGVSLHRVQTLVDTGASYRVDVGGAVAIVGGTDFLVYGPTDENVVGIVCLDDCTEETTFAGCPMGPNVAYWVETDRRQVMSGCQPFSAQGDIWNAPDQLRLTERLRR